MKTKSHILRYGRINELHAERSLIADMRDDIRRKFVEHFGSCGFFEHQPSGLIPKYDKSVLFTGSTISTFKPYFVDSNRPNKDFYIVQNCLRTQNALNLTKDEIEPQWASYFSSIGTFNSYTKLSYLCAQTWEFFADSLHVPISQLRVRVSSKDRDLYGFWKKSMKPQCLEVDANTSSYYTHKFGLQNVYGRNCNLAIFDRVNGVLRDIGNIIVIEVDEEPYAMEIAFGVETIVSRLLGLSMPIGAAPIADIVPCITPHSMKFADALCAAMVILKEGERPIATNRGRVLRKYLQGVSYLRHKINVTPEDIARYAENFQSKYLALSSDIPSKICRYVIEYENLKAREIPSEKINETISQIFL